MLLVRDKAKGRGHIERREFKQRMSRSRSKTKFKKKMFLCHKEGHFKKGLPRIKQEAKG